MDVNSWVRILSARAPGPRGKMTCRDRDLPKAWYAQDYQREQIRCCKSSEERSNLGVLGGVVIREGFL